MSLFSPIEQYVDVRLSLVVTFSEPHIQLSVSPTATLCMPGFPPRHVCVAERRVLPYLTLPIISFAPGATADVKSERSKMGRRAAQRPTRESMGEKVARRPNRTRIRQCGIVRETSRTYSDPERIPRERRSREFFPDAGYHGFLIDDRPALTLPWPLLVLYTPRKGAQSHLYV